MLAANDYLPIGTVVLLRKAIKKVMVIGIMPSRMTGESLVNEYDYLGVTYPEGFINNDALLLFNHDQILDVVFEGYRNPERTEFVNHVQRNMDKLLEQVKVQPAAQ
ncbi:MAG: DUF4176 domain-containing protein [Ruminococcaceae bacterium]|nr:DUF4176 domain-containing protein [Oscillospiraceae bacterium]